jgi:ribosomal protein L40E
MQTGAQLDSRADVYALGTIAYHMLGGRPPFSGDITQLIAQKLLEPPPPLSTLRSDLPPEVEKAVMRALSKEVTQRPASAVEWFDEFEAATGKSEETAPASEARVVIMAPAGSEVYVDDERYGSVGRSGRVILSSIPPGQHVLRVAKSGETDDERVIEVRPDGAEQIIQALFKSAISSQHLTPSKGGSLDSRTGTTPAPGVVVCMRCGSRFAEGIKFCGKCGNTTFQVISSTTHNTLPTHVDEVVCPRCSHRYAPGTRFCGRCGIPIGAATLDWNRPRSVEVFCRGCSTSYPAGTRFCGRCGKPISS